MAPQKTPIPAIVRSVPESFPWPIAWKTSSKPKTPQETKMIMFPMRNPTSPMWVTMNAFLPASAADFFSNQKPISR
jgi:hypothetical protein